MDSHPPRKLQLPNSTGEIFSLNVELTASQGSNVLGVVWAIPRIGTSNSLILGSLRLAITTDILQFSVELNAKDGYGIISIYCPGTWLLTLEL